LIKIKVMLEGGAQMQNSVSLADLDGSVNISSRNQLYGGNSASITRTFGRNELVFAIGDQKLHAYRIDRGEVCVYRPLMNGTIEFIEFAVAGDIVGLGFLEHYSFNAQATMETQVTCLPIREAERLVAEHPRSQARYSEMVAHEFDSRRADMVAAGRDSPTSRVASLLMFLSRQNASEGFASHIIDADTDGRSVCRFLGLDVDTLAGCLREIESRGIVGAHSNGSIEIFDFDALTALANDTSMPPHGKQHAIA